MKAFTQKNEGEPSDAVLSKTDISGPSAPRILNLTCATQDTIYIQWERPKEYFYSIDYYYINYTSEHSNESIIMESSKEHLDSAVSDSDKKIRYCYSNSSIVIDFNKEPYIQHHLRDTSECVL